MKMRSRGMGASTPGAVLTASVLASMTSAEAHATGQVPGYDCSLTRRADGTPVILGDTQVDRAACMGFSQWADNGPLLAGLFASASGQAARYNPSDPNAVATDTFVQVMDIPGLGAAASARADGYTQKVVKAYVAGLNWGRKVYPDTQLPGQPAFTPLDVFRGAELTLAILQDAALAFEAASRLPPGMVGTSAARSRGTRGSNAIATPRYIYGSPHQASFGIAAFYTVLMRSTPHLSPFLEKVLGTQFIGGAFLGAPVGVNGANRDIRWSLLANNADKVLEYILAMDPSTGEYAVDAELYVSSLTDVNVEVGDGTGGVAQTVFTGVRTGDTLFGRVACNLQSGVCVAFHRIPGENVLRALIQLEWARNLESFARVAQAEDVNLPFSAAAHDGRRFGGFYLGIYQVLPKGCDPTTYLDGSTTACQVIKTESGRRLPRIVHRARSRRTCILGLFNNSPEFWSTCRRLDLSRFEGVYVRSERGQQTDRGNRMRELLFTNYFERPETVMQDVTYSKKAMIHDMAKMVAQMDFSGQPAHVRDAQSLLAIWDGRMDRANPGAVIARLFIEATRQTFSTPPDLSDMADVPLVEDEVKAAFLLSAERASSAPNVTLGQTPLAALSSQLIPLTPVRFTTDGGPGLIRAFFSSESIVTLPAETLFFVDGVPLVLPEGSILTNENVGYGDQGYTSWDEGPRGKPTHAYLGGATVGTLPISPFETSTFERAAALHNELPEVYDFEDVLP